MVAVDLDAVADAGSYTASAAEILSRSVLHLGDDGKSELCISVPPDQQQLESSMLQASSSSVSTAAPLVAPAAPQLDANALPTSGACSRTDSPITLCTTPSAPNTSPVVTKSPSGTSPETLPPHSSTEETPEDREVASAVRFDNMMKLAMEKTFGPNVPKHLQVRMLRIGSRPPDEAAPRRRNGLRSPSARSPPRSPRECSRSARSSPRRRATAQTSPAQPGQAAPSGAAVGASRTTSPTRAQPQREPSRGRQASPPCAVRVGTSAALGSTAIPCKSSGPAQVSARRRSPSQQQPSQQQQPPSRSGTVFNRLFMEAKDRRNRRAIDVSDETTIVKVFGENSPWSQELRSQQSRTQDHQRKAGEGCEDVPAPKAYKVVETWKEPPRKVNDSNDDAPVPKPQKAAKKTAVESQLRHLGARCSALAAEISHTSAQAAPTEPRSSSRDKRATADPAFHERLHSEAQQWNARRMQLIEEHANAEQERLKREAAKALKGTAGKQRVVRRYPSPPRQADFIEKLLTYRTNAVTVAYQDGSSCPQARSRASEDSQCGSMGGAERQGSIQGAEQSVRRAEQIGMSKDCLPPTDAPTPPWTQPQPALSEEVQNGAGAEQTSDGQVQDKSRQDILTMKRQLGLLLLSVDVLKKKVDQYEAVRPAPKEPDGLRSDLMSPVPNEPSLEQSSVELEQDCSLETASFELLDPLPDSPLLAHDTGENTSASLDLVDMMQDAECLEHILVGAMAGMDAAAKVTSVAKQIMHGHSFSSCELDMKADNQCDDLELQERAAAQAPDALNHLAKALQERAAAQIPDALNHPAEVTDEQAIREEVGLRIREEVLATTKRLHEKLGQTYVGK